MDPLSITASLIAVLQVTSAVISICYDYRQGQKHASREVIHLSNELNSLRDVLDALLRLVEKSSDELNDQNLESFDLLAKPDGPLLGCQVELDRLRKKLEPESGWRAVRRSLVWPLQEGEMRKALDALERLKGTMQLALSADQMALTLAIKGNTGNLTQLFQKHSTDQKYQDIFIWLAAPDSTANHVANRKKRQPKSGEWFLSGTQYARWLEGAGSFLWLYGIPGSGKTVLCSTIVDHIADYCQATPKTALAYFYFDFNDTGKRNVEALVRSLITQLAAQSDLIPQPLLKLYDSHHNGKSPVHEHDFLDTLRSMILTFHNVYIVFDALDESSDCEGILGFITAMHDWQLLRLHLLATSRQWAVIEEALEGLVSERICLQNSRMNCDITDYITDKLTNDKTLTRWPPTIRKQIQEVLVAKEDRMFRWVVCQLDMLKRCMSVAAVKKSLTSLPKDLDETYDRILLDIDEFHQVEVMKILQALIVTVETLTLEQVVEILAVDLETVPPYFDPESRLLNPRSVLSICSSLVTLAQSEPESPPLDSYGYGKPDGSSFLALRLAHASVADYLTQLRPSGPSKFHFSQHSARQFFVRTCLTYLLNPQFANGYERSQAKQRLKDFPFLSHTVRFWPMYLRPFDGTQENLIETSTKVLLRAFFSTSKSPRGGNFAFWVGMLIPSSPNSYIVNTHPLYYAASYGLTEVVRIILDTEPDIEIDQLGGRAHSTALHVAVFRNHPDIVKILLEAGANPNIPNNKNESPLYWATATGRMAELLIQYGAGTEQSEEERDEEYSILQSVETIQLGRKLPNPPSHDPKSD